MKKKNADESEILARLGERVEKAVAMIQELRRERDELKARVEELEGYEQQRGEIRERIESILASLEGLGEG